MSDPNQPVQSQPVPNHPDPNQPAAMQQAPSQPQTYQGASYPQPYGVLPEHPQGTVILVLGIAGFFATICAPIAWYLGSKAQKEIAASGQHYSNEQSINIGKIMGMVLSILAVVGIVVTIIVMIIMFTWFGIADVTGR